MKTHFQLFRGLRVMACLPVLLVAVSGNAATLKPAIRVERSGRSLEINFFLRDALGRLQPPDQDATPPEFTVYKNGEEIGSGQFKYG